MSSLHSRIGAQATARAAAQGSYHPYGNADTPMSMPMVLVEFSGAGAAVQQMTPLITSNGAPIPATAPGHFGQVYISGGGRY